MCNLRYKIPKNIPVIFHNGSTYDYHFIIKELACEFEGNFECLGENTEKYITFSVPIKKRIENKNMDITYKIKFIDSFRFMATSLSKLVDNLTDNIHNDKCIKCKSNLCFVNTMNETLIFECVNCKKEYKKDINNKLKERFSNVYEFCNHDMNKFITLLRKGIYPYEYMDEWKKRYAKANNYYMKDSDKNKDSYIQYLDSNNLCGMAMCDKWPVKGFKWMDDISIINEEFVKSYDKKSNKGYILKVDVDYPNELQDLHRDFPFLSEMLVVNNTEKLISNLQNKKDYVVHINTLKQALEHGLKLINVHQVIEFEQEEWLKEYINLNTELRKKANHDCEKDFFKLMNNVVFGKTMENVRKHWDIKLVKTDKKRIKLISEPNFHTMKLIDDNLAIIEMKKVKVKMNKPIYLGMSILDISKITVYEFWYDYIKNKYGEKASLCYTDTDSFIINVKTEDFYKDISENVIERFDTSNYIHERPLPIGVNKKVLGLMKDELGGGIITEFVALRPKAYSYKTEDNVELKKAKGTKKCIINKMLNFNDYKNCLFDNKKVLRSQQRFKSENHSV